MFYKLVHCFGVFVGAFREQLVQKFALLAWDRLRRIHSALHTLKARDETGLQCIQINVLRVVRS
jgi:hypothetical protein